MTKLCRGIPLSFTIHPIALLKVCVKGRHDGQCAISLFLLCRGSCKRKIREAMVRKFLQTENCAAFLQDTKKENTHAICLDCALIYLELCPSPR